MKIFLIVFNNLKNYIKCRDKYLTIIVVSTIAVTVGLMFILGYYFEYTYNKYYKTKMTIKLADCHTKEEATEMVKTIVGFGDRIYSLQLKASENVVIDSPVLWTGDFFVYGNFSRAYDENGISGTSYEIDAEDNKIILGISAAQNIKMTEAVSLYDQNYCVSDDVYELCEITAVGTDNFAAAIPPVVYAQKFETDIVEICFIDGVESIKKSESVRQIQNSPIAEEIDYIDYRNPFCNNSFVSVYAAVYLVFASFLINSLMLLMFWAERSERRGIVYRMVGAAKMQVFVISFAENAIIYFISSLIGICLFLPFVFILKNDGIIYSEDVYPYIYVAGIDFLTLLVFSLIASVRGVRKEKLYKTAE